MRPGRRFTKDETLRRREKVADLYCRGRTQTQIAEDVGVSQRQVSDDLQKVRAWWLESALRNFDQLKAEQLARLDQVEREAWAAWERSIGTHRVEKAEKRSGGIADISIASVTKEERAGNPKFLEIVGSCVSKRCEILGLARPLIKHVTLPVEQLRDRDLEDMIREAARLLPPMVDDRAEPAESDVIDAEPESA